MSDDLQLPSELQGGGFRGILRRALSLSDEDDSLVVTIAEEVGTAIIEGRLRPNSKINSVELSKQFQTSRTPVREALMLLSKAGLIVMPPRKRSFISPLNLERVREIYQVRATLYSLVAELIVSTATNEQICLLEAPLAQMKVAATTNEVDTYFRPNVDFQDIETKICGNSIVKQMLDSLMLQMLRMRHLSLQRAGRIQQSLADHERLLRAYLERDTALAVALKRGIVMRGLANIEQSGWIES